MKTVMIFGASSFVGSNLAEYLSKDFKVVGTYYKNRIKIPDILTVPCNVLEKDEVQLVMYTFKPDYVIYAVGLHSLIHCSQNEHMADGLNAGGLFNVSEFAQRYKAQIVMISSAYVFSGENKNYMEMDIPDSCTVMGKTKAQAEFFIQKTSLNYLIFRCSNLYGRSINPAQFTWFEELQRKLKKNESFPVDNNVHIGFLDVMYLAQILKSCFQAEVKNRLYQISSQNSLTHYEFAEEYCRIFKESSGAISRSRWNFPYIASSGSNYSGGDLHFQMSIDNIEGYLNAKLPTVAESLAFTYSRLGGDSSVHTRAKKGSEITYI